MDDKDKGLHTAAAAASQEQVLEDRNVKHQQPSAPLLRLGDMTTTKDGYPDVDLAEEAPPPPTFSTTATTAAASACNASGDSYSDSNTARIWTGTESAIKQGGAKLDEKAQVVHAYYTTTTTAATRTAPVKDKTGNDKAAANDKDTETERGVANQIEQQGEGAELLATTLLQRSSPIRTEPQPGAIAVEPSPGGISVDNPQIDVNDDDPAQSHSQSQPNMTVAILQPPLGDTGSSPPGVDLEPPLIEARLVVDDDNDDEEAGTVQPPTEPMPIPVEAKPLDFNSNEMLHRFLTSRKGCMLMVFVFAVIAIAVISIVVVVVGNSKSNSSASTTTVVTLPPTPPPTPRLVEPWHFDVLPQFTRDTIANHSQGHQSAQQRALEWLREDPLFDTLPTWRRLQRFAMACLYYATTTDMNVNDVNNDTTATTMLWNNHTGWLDYDQHECQWFQHEDNSEVNANNCGDDMQLKRLDLTENNLGGTLPPELSLLTELKVLNFEDNQIMGTLFSEIGAMTNLQALFVQSNGLSNILPTELGLCTALKELKVSKNDFTGSLPSQVGQLTNLELLWMQSNSNMKNNGIPTELGPKLSNLHTFLASKSNMTGPIPREFYRMTSLETIKIQDNSFTGSILTEIGLLSQLSNFKMERTRIDGRLPTEMGLLTNFQYIVLGENRLSGPIPSEVGLLSDLQSLFLDANSLTGLIPSELGRLSVLEKLGVQGNHQLQGEIPESLFGGSMSNIEVMELFDTMLTGSIPTSFCADDTIEVIVDCTNVTCDCCVCS